MIASIKRKIQEANEKYKQAALQSVSSSSQQGETIVNEGTSSRISGTRTGKRSDARLKLDVEDIGIQCLSQFDCLCSCRYGRKCCRRVSIGEIADARASFWGEKDSKLSTTDRGRKIVELLINAKTHQGNDVIFQFALNNNDGITNAKTIICEGTYRLFIIRI